MPSKALFFRGPFLFFIFLWSLDACAGEEGSKERVERENLAQGREWRRLLHYRNFAGWDNSQADSERFFLAEKGYEDLRAELFALLDQSTTNLDKIDDQHAICRFPARTKWLY